MQLGLQAIREQFAGLVAALGHKDGDCSTCRHDLDRRHEDHEHRLRSLEQSKWKLVGALLFLGPILGGVFGALTSQLADKVFK